MKKIVLLLLCYCCVNTLSKAQNSRIAYINTQTIYSQWADYRNVENTLTSLRKQQQQDYEAKVKLAHGKALQLAAAQDTLVSKQNLMSRSQLRSELSQLSKQVQTLEQEMQQTYLSKEKEQKTALQARIQQAINTVAAEKNYTGVTDVNQMLYYDKADDITAAVLIKLGSNAK